MRTPPGGLDADDLCAVLARCWELGPVSLTYAPVGFGSHHWLATVDGAPTWFVTVDARRDGLPTAYEVAADLRDEARLPFVVAPVRGGADEVVASCGDAYLVSVTPFLHDARDWPETAHATPVHHRATAELAAALHSALVSTEPWEDDFVIESREGLEDALDRLDLPCRGGPYADRVHRGLRAAADRVRTDLEAYDDLTRRVRARGADPVVTHGELKPGNLLVTPHGPALVDWDTVLLAPPERDLWRLADADPTALDHYTALTGRTVDADALELYRRRWDLTDTALYVVELPTAPAGTADTDVAWEALQTLLTRAAG